jgi:hypothetical protein
MTLVDGKRRHRGRERYSAMMPTHLLSAGSEIGPPSTAREADPTPDPDDYLLSDHTLPGPRGDLSLPRQPFVRRVSPAEVALMLEEGMWASWPGLRRIAATLREEGPPDE